MLGYFELKQSLLMLLIFVNKENCVILFGFVLVLVVIVMIGFVFYLNYKIGWVFGE